jgi:hypothetical protein
MQVNMDAGLLAVIVVGILADKVNRKLSSAKKLTQ